MSLLLAYTEKAVFSCYKPYLFGGTTLHTLHIIDALQGLQWNRRLP